MVKAKVKVLAQYNTPSICWGLAVVTNFAAVLAHFPRDILESTKVFKKKKEGKRLPTLKCYFANSLNFVINKDCKWEENA